MSQCMTLIRCRVVDARLGVLIHGASAQLFERERVKGGKEGNLLLCAGQQVSRHAVSVCEKTNALVAVNERDGMREVNCQSAQSPRSTQFDCG
jgi:hypothetical protein